MKKLIQILLAVLLMFSVISCGKKTENEPAVSSDEQQETYDFYKSEEDVYEINSEHCTLFFPTKWKENIKTEVYEDETAYKVSFFAVFGEDSVPLYDFIFGTSQEGALLGTIKTDAGEQNVYLIDQSSAQEGQIPEEHVNTYYEMCESVNDIISNLVYASGMTLAE